MVGVCHTDGLQCFTALVLQAIHRKQPFPSSMEFHFWLWHMGWLQCGSGSQELQCSAPAVEEENGVSDTSCQLRVIVGPSTAIQNAELHQVSPLGLQKCGFCNGPVLYSVSGELSAGAFEVILRSFFRCRFSAEISYSEHLRVSPHFPIFTNYDSVSGASLPCWIWLGVSKYLVLRIYGGVKKASMEHTEFAHLVLCP